MKRNNLQEILLLTGTKNFTRTCAKALFLHNLVHEAGEDGHGNRRRISNRLVFKSYWELPVVVGLSTKPMTFLISISNHASRTGRLVV